MQPSPRPGRPRVPVLLLLCAAALLLGSAAREWGGYRRIASLPVRADGSPARGPRLKSAARYAYQVRLMGALRGTYNGATYAAASVTDIQGQSVPHNALEVEPPQLVEAPSMGTGRRVFLVPPGTDLDGREVTARLLPERFVSEMYLPEGAQAGAVAGELRLEVWERDAVRQTALAGLLGGLSLLCLGAGAAAWSRGARAARQG